jgi:hypothetical protein
MMRLNVINNYKTIYYNFLASFYLCLNCVLPYYDDVIISLQSQAIKLLIDNDALNMKKVKKIRMIEFIDSLDKSDKIILDKEKDIILIDYCIYECHDDSNGSSRPESGPEQETEPETETETETDSNTNEAGAKDSEKTSSDSERTSSDSDPDKDPYEPRKKKSRIDNDYIPQPTGPMKDKDDYYNMGVYAVSATAAAAATAANNAAKYLIEDSGSNSADTTDTADTADTDEDGLDKEIDVSIRNIIQHIIYDKNKDD